MGWSFSLGRLYGSELRVHATFFLLLLWIGTAALMVGGWPAAIENVLFVAALFACVVAHEFGHALTARRYGIKTPDITLLPIGGMARLEKMPEDPWQEIKVALAGPAVNVVIWAVLVFVFGQSITADQLESIENVEFGFWSQLAAVNLFLAVFNLLPAFPMDGGRVLRAALALKFDRVRATQIAAHAGQTLAFVFGFLGLISGNILLVLVAFFVFIAAGAESSDVALRQVAERLRARDAMITEFEALGPDDHIEQGANALIRTTQHEFPVLDALGHPLGVLSRTAIFQATSEDGGRMRRVADVMIPDMPRVLLASGLSDALDAMRDGAGAVAVCNRDGVMVGYITRENIGELMVLQSGRM